MRTNGIRLTITALIFAAIAVLFLNFLWNRPKGPGPDAATFDRIEAALLGARTLRVRFVRDGLFRNNARTLSTGTLLLKEGNRLLLETREERSGVPVTDLRLVSDGTRWASTMTKDGKSLLIPLFDGTRKPGDLKARATTILARLSPTYVMQVIEPSLAEIREERYPVRNVKAGPDEGSAATLSCDVAIFHVTLWYDPRTLLPTRRVTKSDHGDVVTETYSEMTVDAELPDELFRMPEEKK